MSTYSLIKNKVSFTYHRLLQIDGNTVLDGLGVTVSISDINLQGIYTSYSVLRSDVNNLMGGTQSGGGFTGPQGFQGITGPTGMQGNQGFQGDIGETGPQGIQGITGPTGMQGNQGFQGIQGISGLTGVQGLQGWQGFLGNTGSQGPIGFQGNIGEFGITGFQGPTGIAGGYSIVYIFDSESGYVPGHLEGDAADATLIGFFRVSSTDFYGNDMSTQLEMWDAQFSRSPNILLKIYDIQDNNYYHYYLTTGNALRYEGPDGLQISAASYLGGCGDVSLGLRTVGLSIFAKGDTGNQGFQGNFGPAGFQGHQGPLPDAVPGPQGSQGPQGAIGLQGFQGRQGFQGFQGRQGNQGFQGTTGSQGFQGPVSSSVTGILITTQSFTSSSASNTDVTGLTFSTEAGSRYLINVIGLFRSNNASGNPGFGLDGGAGATISGWVRRGTTTAPTSNQGWINNGVVLQGAATMTANTDFPFVLEASLVTPSFGGTVSVIVTSTSPHILTIQPNAIMSINKVG